MPPIKRSAPRPRPAQRSFRTRYQATCRECGGFMPPGTEALKLPVGVMHAAHRTGWQGRAAGACDHSRHSWGVCRSCGSPV